MYELLYSRVFKMSGLQCVVDGMLLADHSPREPKGITKWLKTHFSKGNKSYRYWIESTALNPSVIVRFLQSGPHSAELSGAHGAGLSEEILSFYVTSAE